MGGGQPMQQPGQNPFVGYSNPGVSMGQPQTQPQPFNPNTFDPNQITGQTQQFMQPQLGAYNPQLETMSRMYQGQQPMQPQTQPFNPMNRPQQPQQPQQRGLGGLQLDKFRNRLGQR